MDDERVERAADRRTSRFRIENDRSRFCCVSAGINEGMHDAGARFDDRNAAVFPYEVDQRLTAARDHHVNHVICLEHRFHGFPVRREEEDRMLINPVLLQHCLNQSDDGCIRILRIASALEYAGIPRLEAERERIYGDVRPRFVDDADHPERDRDFLDMQAIWSLSLF